MLFQFHVNITPSMYVDFNAFVMTKTPYGKKQTRTFRVLFSVLVVLLMVLMAIRDGLNVGTLIGYIPAVLMWAAFMIGFPKLQVWAVKSTVKGMSKNGKAGYDPKANMVFYEDHFEEIIPDRRTTQAYTTIERVDVESGKGVYLFTDNLRGYILPMTAFESPAQYEQFLAFLKTKVVQVNAY